MDYGLAVPVTLDVWKDPQCFTIIEHIRDEARIYFQCWQTPGTPADFIGCLHFEGVWHVESSRHQQTRSYPNVDEHDLHSYYLEVTSSSLIRSLKHHRSAHDPGWADYDHRTYHHYIVENHDYFTHIVAQKVVFSTISSRNEQARRLSELWESV